MTAVSTESKLDLRRHFEGTPRRDQNLTRCAAYPSRVQLVGARLRSFYYPYLFNEVRFGPEDFAGQPRFEPGTAASAVPVAQMLGLALWAVLGLIVGLAAVRRVTRDGQ